jgi:hypothetical protein
VTIALHARADFRPPRRSTHRQARRAQDASKPADADVARGIPQQVIFGLCRIVGDPSGIVGDLLGIGLELGRRSVYVHSGPIDRIGGGLHYLGGLTGSLIDTMRSRADDLVGLPGGLIDDRDVNDLWQIYVTDRCFWPGVVFDFPFTFADLTRVVRVATDRAQHQTHQHNRGYDFHSRNSLITLDREKTSEDKSVANARHASAHHRHPHRSRIVRIHGAGAKIKTGNHRTGN